MKKERAIKFYVDSTLAEAGGAGDLGLESEHVYYEACRVINENGWEKEAQEALNTEREKRREKIQPVIDLYCDCLAESNDANEDTKRAFLTIIQKFDVSGREEIKAKFKASHQGREIDERYLEELLKHRHHVDDVNRKIFQRNIVALMRLEPFNLEELNKAIKNLADHGLLKAEIKRIPSSMTKASLGILEEWLKN